MRGSKWKFTDALSAKAVLGVTRECEQHNQAGVKFFSKAMFIENIARLDKNRSGHVKRFV